MVVGVSKCRFTSYIGMVFCGKWVFGASAEIKKMLGIDVGGALFLSLCACLDRHEEGV